jgi:hypothetical protein
VLLVVLVLVLLVVVPIVYSSSKYMEKVY